MHSTTPWNKVASYFDTYKDNVWYGAADNIDTVWPVILGYAKKYFPKPQNKKALDFGCGVGMFCQEFSKLDFEAWGIDLSGEMIKIGKQHLDAKIKISVGDTYAAKTLSAKKGGFNLITAIMVLQFVEEKNLANLAETLSPQGHLIFSTHNPNQLIKKDITDTFTLSGTEVSVPIYIRQPKDYDRIFLNLGFTKTLETFAQSSVEFLKKYSVQRDLDIPKYMILAYQKKLNLCALIRAN